MAETFLFELVTPERLALSEQVDMVEVPGELGDFGVLVGHAPFFSMIRPGVIAVHKGDAIERFFVPAGYAEVNPEGCRVLAEHVTAMTSATREMAEAKLLEAQEKLAGAENDVQRKRAEKALEAAQTFRDLM
ncbi:MAG: ATP synthase F1 subunit epsilon [Rickettsiales bacterium]|nr:ATP synthase F1 subunit epsilon [Rickettsiales bacterium]|tara:strand:- start:522 stop:917 length:396 start_codon:yes stop_codon:yes gene_type:complete